MSKVIIQEKKILSDNWYKLYKVIFEIENTKGERINTSGEA